MTFQQHRLSIVIFISFFLLRAFPQTGELVLDIDFENHPGAYTDYNIASANIDFDGIENRVSAEIRGLDGPKTWPQRTKAGEGNLRAHFPAFMATGQKTGFLFDKGFENTEGAIMEYRLKFSDGFQWKLGGKLPGLGGGLGYPVGCTQNLNTINNGFTTRLMWRREGRGVVYTYFPDRNISKCGVDLTFFNNFQTNRWYTVKQHLTLNTPGKYNGTIKMYVDGVLVYEKNDLLIRLKDKDNVKINRAVFHTYSGGSDDSDWWSTVDQHIYFDDFKVWINTSEAPEPELEIRIDEPAPNAVFYETDPVNISAMASGPTPIEKVIFSLNDSIIKEDTTTPFSATWISEKAGNYTIRARVISSNGIEKSDSVSIRVVEKPDDKTFVTVFYDDFNRGKNIFPLSNGGMPTATYSVATWVSPVNSGGATAGTTDYEGSDNILQLLGQNVAPPAQTGNRTEVYGTLSSYSAPFKTVLNQNQGLVSWRFTLRNNRNSLGGTPGFDATNQGIAVILAASNSNFHTQKASNANGYALVILKNSAGTAYEASLVRFTNGLSNRITIAGPTAQFSSLQTWITAGVDYKTSSNEWELYFRDEASKTIKGDIDSPLFPIQENAKGTDSLFTKTPMTHFGFALNTPNAGATGAVFNALYLDDYRVSIAVDNATPMNRVDFNNLMTYPNPAKTQFTIYLPKSENAIYTLYNATGSKVTGGILKRGENIINVASYPRGIYFIGLESEKNRLTRKMVLY